MLNLKIIINCGPCQEYIQTCLNSVKSQTYTNWQAYVTIDPSSDKTFEKAVQARGRDERIFTTANPRRLYTMANQVQAIGRSGAQPDDVIVILDGDDWFYVDNALEIIVDTYSRHDCWMTYGSWVSNAPELLRFPGRWPSYEKGTTDFRHTRWLGTAVRTWKKWLWDLIDDKDLRDETGEYFRITEDTAVMLPMLEMSGTDRAKHISNVLMIYNRANPNSCGDTKRSEMRRNAQYIYSKTPYKLLKKKVLL